MALQHTLEPAAAPRAESGHNGRREASQLPAVTVRFSPHGTPATLINISPNGLLAECPIRLSVGAPVTVQFEGALPVSSVVSRVARCSVSSIGPDGVLRYHVGLAFNTPITLEDPQAPPAPVVADTVDVAAPSPAPVPAPAVAEATRPVLQNRW